MPYYGWKRPAFKRIVLSPADKKVFNRIVGPHSLLPAGHPVSLILAQAGMGAQMPLFLAYKNLKPFISKELTEVLSTPHEYLPKK